MQIDLLGRPKFNNSKANVTAKNAMADDYVEELKEYAKTAEIYSSDGEMIASYNSHGGGWTIQLTQAESKFLRESAMIYKQAFDAARTEMNATTPPHRLLYPVGQR